MPDAAPIPRARIRYARHRTEFPGEASPASLAERPHCRSASWGTARRWAEQSGAGPASLAESEPVARLGSRNLGIRQTGLEHDAGLAELVNKILPHRLGVLRSTRDIR